MTFAKEQLIREIETLPDTKVERVAVFVNTLKTNGNAVDAATLEAKFAEEDRQIAAQGLTDPRYHLTLDEMIDLITEENRHAEIQMGPPVGNEVW